MNAKVERYLWFKREDGMNLRYSETSPHEEHEDNQICNCTREVAVRPEGKPRSVRQICEFTEKIGDRSVQFRLPDNVIYRWDDPELERPHAYFDFDCNGHENCLSVEVAKKGCGSVDCFFGHVFFGNKVDTSTLMNGHAPSRVVRLEDLKQDDVWAHDCCWGMEAVAVFKEEAEFWRHIKSRMSVVRELYAPYANDHEISVDELRTRLQFHVDLGEMVKGIALDLGGVLDRLEETELFKVCHALEKDTYERMLARDK